MQSVAYLEIDDLSPEGLAPYVGNGKPVVLMIQGNFCHFCTEAKPAFQKFAQSNIAAAASIVIDGDPSEKKAYEVTKIWNQTPGVPAFLGFDKTGKFVKIHKGSRDVNSLTLFSKSL